MYPSIFIWPLGLDEYFKCELRHSIFKKKMSNNSDILIIYNNNAVQKNQRVGKQQERKKTVNDYENKVVLLCL